jgi:hypothetical protein
MLVNPPAHANPRVAAKEGIRARQFLIEGIRNSKFSHLDTSQLKAELNKLLIDAGIPSGKIRTITTPRGGGTIIETDTDEAASWLTDAANQRKLCDLVGLNAEFRTRTYNIIAFNVPTDIVPEDVNHRQEINEVNDLEPSTIVSARWAKAIARRAPNQRTAHLLLTFNNADAANRAISNGLTVCNRRCRVERTKCEPTRCLKCQGWNHIAKDCIEDQSKCANCAGNHRTDSCIIGEKRCVSCKSEDHASWSRNCPTFLRRCDEFNIRNPDNSLQFFPTSDSWTWTATEKGTTPAPRFQARPSNVQLGKRPQQPKKTNDTYIPSTNRQTDTYIPARQNDTYIPIYEDPGWGNDPGPSGSRPSQSRQPTQRPNQEAIVSSTTQNSNRPVNPTPMNNA